MVDTHQKWVHLCELTAEDQKQKAREERKAIQKHQAASEIKVIDLGSLGIRVENNEEEEKKESDNTSQPAATMLINTCQ